MRCQAQGKTVNMHIWPAETRMQANQIQPAWML